MNHNTDFKGRWKAGPENAGPENAEPNVGVENAGYEYARTPSNAANLLSHIQWVNTKGDNRWMCRPNTAE